jgi:outer membrane immunogenic protein
MNRIQIAASALAATVSFASMACAADMAVKAPPMAPVPATSWIGYYVGVNAGGTWGGSDIINVASVPTFAISPFINTFPIPTSMAAANAASGNLSGRAGFIGGAQIGYNQQFSDRFVAGIETDFQGTAKAKATRTNSTDAGIGLPGNNVTATIAANKIPDYLGTVRGRLGFLPQPALLLYTTGGLAYGGGSSTSISGTNNGVNLGLCCGNPPFNSSGSLSGIRAGWTIGAGAEWMFAAKWSAKIEYLYYDLGRVSYSAGTSSPLAGPNSGGIPVGAVVYSIASQTSTRLDGNILRIGLNYRFGG